MGKPTLTWSTSSGGLFNNTFVADTSPPATHANGDPILDTEGNPAVPITNYKKTRNYNLNPATGTEGTAGYVAAYYTTSYTSSNPAASFNGNHMIAIKGGVYEKAEFITSQLGASAKPTTGNDIHANNVVFVDTGSAPSPLSFGPKIAAADNNPSLSVPLPRDQDPNQSMSPHQVSKGSNVESNVGWVATTLNATAGFHSNSTSTPFSQGSPTPTYTGLGPAPASFISGTSTLTS